MRRRTHVADVSGKAIGVNHVLPTERAARYTEHMHGHAITARLRFERLPGRVPA